MKMKINIITASILSTLSLSVSAQDTSTPKFNSDLEVKAVIDAGCFLTAENINFGVLQMPLSDQSSSSNIKIHCSKNTNLKISITYGDHISSNNQSTYSVENISNSVVNIYENNVYLGRISCMGDNSFVIYNSAGDYGNPQLANILGLAPEAHTGGIYHGTCYSKGTFNLENFNNRISSMVSTFGKLTGLSSNENIIYSLSNPNNSSNSWSALNTYNIIADGLEQIVPMKANIKRSDNGTHRMTPDTYQSTLTVVLTY